MLKFAQFAGLAVSSFIFSEGAFALPLPTEAQRLEQAAARPTFSLFAPTVDFTAIVALSNCSGSIVRFETSLETDKALILTNGHCIGQPFLAPGEVKVEVPANRTFSLLSRDGRKILGKLTAEKLAYATMTGTDLALYRLEETYQKIENKFGVRALTMSSRRPIASRPIAIASGYWKKIYACSIDGLVNELREADWTFSDSIRYTAAGCKMIGGTSGSPVIDAETYEVVGVNNTGNEGGVPCTVNNPCEVDESGNVTTIPDRGYAQQTYWVYSCLTTDNRINLKLAGCQLPQ